MNFEEVTNQFKLVHRLDSEGNEIRAVELRIQVPEGVCWKELGRQMLNFGSYCIGQALVKAAPRLMTPEEEIKKYGVIQ